MKKITPFLIILFTVLIAGCCEKTITMNYLEHNMSTGVLKGTLGVKCYKNNGGMIDYRILDNKTQTIIYEGGEYFQKTSEDGEYEINFNVSGAGILPMRYYLLYYKLPGEDYLKRSFYGELPETMCEFKPTNYTCTDTRIRRGYYYNKTTKTCESVETTYCNYIPYYVKNECEEDCLNLNNTTG